VDKLFISGEQLWEKLREKKSGNVNALLRGKSRRRRNKSGKKRSGIAAQEKTNIPRLSREKKIGNRSPGKNKYS
jgi:hypothetical protein